VMALNQPYPTLPYPTLPYPTLPYPNLPIQALLSRDAVVKIVYARLFGFVVRLCHYANLKPSPHLKP